MVVDLVAVVFAPIDIEPLGFRMVVSPWGLAELVTWSTELGVASRPRKPWRSENSAETLALRARTTEKVPDEGLELSLRAWALRQV